MQLDQEVIDALGSIIGEQGEEQKGLEDQDLGTAAPPLNAPFFNWQKDVRDAVRNNLRDFASANNAPRWYFDTYFERSADQLMAWLENFVYYSPQEIQDRTSFESTGYERMPVGVNATHPTGGEADYLDAAGNPHIPGGIENLVKTAANWISQDVPGFGDWYNGGDVNIRTGGGGGGSRKPTAAELRAQFDIDKLTRDAQKMARAFLVEDIDNARDIAVSYVNAVVSSGGEQAIDYGEWVNQRLEKTTRWKQIYRNKPEGVNPLDYIQPYANAAQQALGGNRGQGISQVVGEGAALAGNAQSFGARLAKEDTVKNQSNFITGLEKRMSNISGILR